MPRLNVESSRWKVSSLALAAGLLLSPAALAAPALGAGLTLPDGSAAGARRSPIWDQAPSKVGASWSALRQRLGVARTLWDPETGAPVRLWGAGVAAPGAISTPGRAQRIASELLQAHLDVLAPGADAADFVVVADVLSRGVRSVGFAQRLDGRPVVGGQISFRFKRDRLVMIASEFVPVAGVALSDAPIAADVARARTRAWITGELGALSGLTIGAVEGPMILPLRRRGRSQAHEVLRVEVAAAQPLTRAWIYVAAADGAVVAVESRLRSGVASLVADVPVRYPLSDRHELPLIGVNVTIDGAPAVTDGDGALVIPDVPSAVVATVEGALVKVVNDSGDDATKAFDLGPGDVGVWSGADDPLLDSQLTNYVSVLQGKERVKVIAPDFAWLDGQIVVTSNLGGGTCNAYSDGESLFFFKGQNGVCEHTARLPDVSYHELGHSVHAQSIIPGVGVFEGALSEGISDYLAATITGDPKMGRGFFLTDEPLRDLDPEGSEWHWPEDRGEVHDEGRIIGGALWDLRKALVAKLGEADGVAKTDEIWYESIRRARDIPTMYPEALLADDDDGDLSNGTPNSCEIDQAFYIHGLVGPAAFGASVVTEAPIGDGGVPVKLLVDPQVKADCLGLVVEGATLEWRPRGVDAATTVVMDADTDGFAAVIPPQADRTVIEYRVKVTLSDGSSFAFPDNEADPWYQRYYGPVVPIYCTGFEDAAGQEGWQIFNEWAFGAPLGFGGDPDAAHEGTKVAGVDLGDGDNDGLYDAIRTSRTRSPVIDVGDFAEVRLQYWRWLGVEDHEFDSAVIAINEKTAWTNATRGLDPELNDLHHIDREWRFHDLEISEWVADGKVQVSFVITADGGLELGGWNLDSLCVVGVESPPAPVCGDGVVDAGEACDDGNTVGGDGCDPTCAIEPTGDTDTDGAGTGGTGDGSATGGESESGATTGSLDDDAGGCGCATAGPGHGALGSLFFAGLVVFTGRRRRVGA